MRRLSGRSDLNYPQRCAASSPDALRTSRKSDAIQEISPLPTISLLSSTRSGALLRSCACSSSQRKSDLQRLIKMSSERWAKRRMLIGRFSQSSLRTCFFSAVGKFHNSFRLVSPELRTRIKKLVEEKPKWKQKLEDALT